MAHAPPVNIDSLRRLAVFRTLPAPAVDQLLRASSVRRLLPRERLSPTPAGANEDYWFVLEGMLAIALAGEGATRDTSSARTELEYLGCLGPGACFSDGYRSAASTSGPQIDCIAASEATLLRVGRPPLFELMERHQTWGAQLLGHIRAARNHFLSQQEPRRRVVQDFYLRHGLATCSKVRVGQLDRCLDCDKCEEACAKRHGVARLVRFGPRLGRLVFPIVCRCCQDRPCIAACGFGALYFDETSGDVRISSRCKGCGGCAAACPNGAISLVPTPYVGADFPDPIPLADQRGMTNVGDLFVAGDLCGAALIRLAINEAVRAVDAIGPRRRPPDPAVADVAIVGAGPAGLAAALRCRERHLSYWVLERDRLASTIQDYPKHKHVMAEPSGLPLLGSLWFEACTKEELLERWQAIAAEARLPIVEGAEVRRIEWQGDWFNLETAQGLLAAEHVLLCVGKRGAPRRLGLPGESFPRVRYLLSDADELAGQHVLIVGGGDSAVEAALSLARVPGTRVTLSYRRGAFTRAQALNRQRLLEAEAAGALRIELNSTVKSLEPGRVRLTTERGEVTIDNQVVLALLGADPPTDFLRQSGIRVLEPGSPEMEGYAATRGMRQRAIKCDHCAGFPDRACLRACPLGGLTESEPNALFVEQRRDAPPGSVSFSEAPFLEGMRQERHPFAWLARGALLFALIGIGLECFLRRTLPASSLMAVYLARTGLGGTVSFGSGRGLGHWLGYIGTSLMLLSLVYSLRTRIARFKPYGRQSVWLSLHLWVGFTGATLVTYHSALQVNRWASIACFLMWLLVLTGVLGRYVYGKVHSGLGLAEFELKALERHRSSLAEEHGQSRTVRRLLGRDWSEATRRTGLFSLLWQELRDRVLLAWLRVAGLGRIAHRRDVVRAMSEWARSRRAYARLENAKAWLVYWNVVHIVVAILMFILAGIHVVYGFLYKPV